MVWKPFVLLFMMSTFIVQGLFTQSINVEVISTSQIDVSWTGQTTTYENITLVMNDGDVSRDIDITIDGIESFTGLSAGMSYLFTVYGSLSADGSTDTLAGPSAAATPPATPVNLRATTVTSNSIFLQWETSPRSHQDSFTLQYHDVAEAGVIKRDPRISPAASITHSLTDLLPGRNYSISVWASKDIIGKPYKSSIATLFVNTMPLPPVINKLEAVNTTSLRVTFSPEQGSVQDYFKITFTTNSNLAQVANPQCTQSPCVIGVSGGIPGSLYTIEISAVSGGSESTKVMMTTNTKPSPPGALTANSTTSNKIILMSLMPQNTVIGGEVLSVSPTLESEPRLDQITPNYRITMSGLTPGQTYTVEFSLYSGAAFSEKATGAFTSRPPTPSKPFSESATTTTLIVGWTMPEEGIYQKFTVSISPGDITQDVLATEDLRHEFTDLMPGENYVISLMTVVSGSNGDGGGFVQSDKASTTMTTKPESPTQVTGNSTTTTFGVKWKAPTMGKYDRFEVKLVAVPDTFKNVIRNSTLEASYTGLTPGTSYTVEIISISGSQNSAPATKTFYTKPNMPRNIRQATITNSSIIVQWDRPVGGKFDKYIMKLNDSAMMEISKEDTTYSFSDLQPATLYSITLISVIDTESSAEQVVNVLTNPNSPRNIDVTGTSTSSVTFSWQSPIGPTIDLYRYNIRTADNSHAAGPTETASTTVSVTAGLVAGATYTINIAAKKQIPGSPSTYTSSIVASKIATLEPNHPVGLAEDDKGQSTITVTWEHPQGIFDQFEVQINDTTARKVASNTKSHEFTGLLPGVTYSITVVTLSNTQRSTSAQVTITTEPNTVAEIALVEKDTTSIEVSWLEPEGSLDSFRLSIEPSTTSSITIQKGQNYNKKFEKLIPGKTYSITIEVFSGNSVSDAKTRDFTTTPLPVINLSIGSVRTDQFTVHWEVDPSSIQTIFQIDYQDAELGGKLPTIDVVAGQQNTRYSRLVENLQPGHNYNISVKAVSGPKSDANSDAVTTNQTTLPAILSMLNATVKGSDSIELTWETNDNSAQDSYEIRYKSMQKSPILSSPLIEVGNSRLFDGLFPGDKYTFEVTALSNGQKGDPKSVVGVTNPLSPPDLQVDVSTINSIAVSWKFDDSKTYATGFKVYQTRAGGGDRMLEHTITNIGDRSKTVGSLLPGYNYTIDVFAITYDNKESLSPSSVQGTVQPEISSELKEIPEETTNDTVTLNYTESTVGVFDKYRFTIYKGDDETLNIHKDNDDINRKVAYQNLLAGYLYTVKGFTISGDEVSPTPKETKILTHPNPPVLMCDSSNDYAQTIHVTLTKQYGFVQYYHIQCAGINCPNERSVDDSTGSTSFNNLKPHTEYSFTFWSSITMDGMTKQSIKSTKSCITGQAAPSAPRKFNYTSVLPYEVEFSWEEPEESNGVLTGYQISYRGTRQTYETHEGDHEITDVSTKASIVTGLIAGYSYIFWISAKTVEYGERSNVSVALPIKEPYKIQALIADSQPRILNISHDWFQVELLNPFSNNNGEITSYSVIVTQRSLQSNEGDITRSYTEANQQEPMPPYVAIKCKHLFINGNACWGFTGILNRRRREPASEPETVILRIGGDAYCESPQDGYCNGPLHPDTTHWVLLRAYTENGLYSDTFLSNVIQTEPPPPPDIPVAVISACLAVLVVLIVVMAVVLVMWRKGRICAGENDDDYEFQSEYMSSHPSSRSFSNAVNKKDFVAHHKKMSADCDFRYAEEFETLKPVGVDSAHRASEEDANRLKNRFTNILPYDHSRVKLLPTDDEEGSDYVNANWMPGYNSKREFLVTQGPLPGTKDEFWRMIWEHNATAIVMLTQCVEKGKEKCDHYWPLDSEPMFYGDLQVAIMNETKSPCWVITEFKISKGEQSRKVRHFHFIAWKDFGVPEAGPSVLVKFVRLVRETVSFDHSPIVVHCSAGVGRSGTYIVVDNMLQRIKEHDTLDVLATVYEMRKQRCYMVQTEQQYIFIHECLQYVLEGKERAEDTYGGQDNDGYEVRDSVDTVADMFFQLAPRQALSSDEDDGWNDEGIAEH